MCYVTMETAGKPLLWHVCTSQTKCTRASTLLPVSRTPEANGMKRKRQTRTTHYIPVTIGVKRKGRLDQRRGAWPTVLMGYIRVGVRYGRTEEMTIARRCLTMVKNHFLCTENVNTGQDEHV